MKPNHEHDCTTCKYLGTFAGADMYYHHDDKVSVFCTYVARFSGNGPDYTSAPYGKSQLFLLVMANFLHDQYKKDPSLWPTHNYYANH